MHARREMIPGVRGLRAWAVAVVVSTPLLGGCGGSSAITKAHALAYVRAVNLKAGDVADFAPFSGEAGGRIEGAELQHEVLRCGHRGHPRGQAVAAQSSLLVDHREEVVASIVIVMPTEALAKAEIATLRSQRGRACMAHTLRLAEAEAPQRSSVYASQIGVVPVARTLGSEAIDAHLFARLQKARRTEVKPRRKCFRLPRPKHFRRGRQKCFRLPPPAPPANVIYAIEAIFRVGAADILLYTLNTHRRFPSAAIESHLLGLLYSRAKAHKL